MALDCASGEATIPLGGDATTFRKSLLTQLEEVTTNQRKVDNGAVMGETKQEEALSKLPDVPAEAMTELGGEGRAKERGHAHGCRADVRSSATA